MPPSSGLPWPLFAIDIEASSLDLSSYPIEVGLALWSAPDEPILGWSTLIRPTEEWRLHGHWSPASAKVHGIRGRDLLARGHPPQAVAAALNGALAACAVAWCDGGPYDARWIAALFKAAGARPAFSLRDWHQLASLLGGPARERGLLAMEQAPAQHRARPDAEDLLRALATAMGVDPGPAESLASRIPALAALDTPIV